MDLDYLKDKGLSLARWYGHVDDEGPSPKPQGEMSIGLGTGRKYQKPPPRHLNAPFTIGVSPELTFAMPLVMEVWDTFQCRTLMRLPRTALVWYPTSLISIFEVCDVRAFQVWLLKNPAMRKHLRSRYGSLPFIYEFTTLAWDISNHISRAQAREKIMAELEKQVDKTLDNTECIAKSYLEKGSDIRAEDHFECLVMYQVNGLSYPDVTRQFLSLSNRSDSFKSKTATIASGIKAAAKKLIGPRFEQWLRASLLGRPKK
jgi:hypothetical protein